MFSIGFGVVFFMILLSSVAVFVGVITVFLRHRQITNRIMDRAMEHEEMLRTARETGAGSPAEPAVQMNRSGDYSCSSCGASLDSETEISPSGDFKCAYCDSWSNVNK